MEKAGERNHSDWQMNELRQIQIMQFHTIDNALFFSSHLFV